MLRTRLTTVKGFGALVGRLARRPRLDRGELIVHTERLNEEIAKLERLQLSFLEALHLQSGAARLQWNPTDLMPLIHQVVESNAHGIPDHRLTIDGPVSVPGLWDRRWLADALAAVIANAFAYSPEGSLVEVRVRRENGHALVTIRDGGAGIQPDERYTIFQPFSRGSAADFNPAGWGLGLFIASQAVIQHGGDIEIESAPGSGSAFTFRLPTSPPPGFQS
jgi:signal transduction histidine kinase